MFLVIEPKSQSQSRPRYFHVTEKNVARQEHPLKVSSTNSEWYSIIRRRSFLNSRVSGTRACCTSGRCRGARLRKPSPCIRRSTLIQSDQGCTKTRLYYYTAVSYERSRRQCTASLSAELRRRRQCYEGSSTACAMSACSTHGLLYDGLISIRRWWFRRVRRGEGAGVTRRRLCFGVRPYCVLTITTVNY